MRPHFLILAALVDRPLKVREILARLTRELPLNSPYMTEVEIENALFVLSSHGMVVQPEFRDMEWSISPDGINTLRYEGVGAAFLAREVAKLQPPVRRPEMRGI